MSSANGPQGPVDSESHPTPLAPWQTMECELFESLVHHLIEKGVLTRNDALSVVQAVAQVKRGELEGGRPRTASTDNELAILKRLYASFELVSDRALTPQVFKGGNILQLRPPLHGDHPEFPEGD